MSLVKASDEDTGHEQLWVKHAAVIIMWEDDLHKIVLTRDVVGAMLARIGL